MSLSVCLVTRNEEKKLPRALGSVAGSATEVIVADTGSSDNTVAIARELGARVVVIAWDDDFSAAQNDALEQARGDWVLWLNPDEELLARSKPALPACLGRDDVLAYWVTVEEIGTADQTEPPIQTMQLRLFRRHDRIRFHGRLHPDFNVPLVELARSLKQSVGRADVVIRRHAYLSVITEDKLRWAARLLEKELADRPGQLHYLIEYGRTLLRLNDPRGHEILAQAAEQLVPLRAGAAAPVHTVSSLLEYLLTVAPQQSKSSLTAADARELALQWFPASPPLLWTMAQQAFTGHEYPQAAQYLERLVELGRTGSYDRGAAFEPSIIGERALLNLGNCYIRMGSLDKAEPCFKLLVSSRTHGTAATQNLALIQGLRGG